MNKRERKEARKTLIRKKFGRLHKQSSDFKVYPSKEGFTKFEKIKLNIELELTASNLPKDVTLEELALKIAESMQHDGEHNHGPAIQGLLGMMPDGKWEAQRIIREKVAKRPYNRMRIETKGKGWSQYSDYAEMIAEKRIKETKMHLHTKVEGIKVTNTTEQ